jgi:hypothetical protein
MVILFLMLIKCLAHSSEKESLILPTQEQVETVLFGFKQSHQLSSSNSISETIKPFVEDACISVPTLSYIAKNSNPPTPLSIQASHSLFSYYIAYQQHLLQPIRNTKKNPFIKLKTWYHLYSSRQQLKNSIACLYQEKIVPHSVSEEFDLNVEIVHRMVKELIDLEKRTQRN